MKIEIHNAEQAEITALTKAIERACQYSQCSADHIEIAVSPRGSTCSNPPDWLEYGISIIKNNSCRFTLQ